MTLLFCDVVRSTELTRSLGDRGAYHVIHAFHEAVIGAAAPLGGEQLELRGDGVLLSFCDPRSALTCAIRIQAALRQAPADLRVDVRIGIHTGAALRVAGGYFGGNVILSARIAGEAAPGEVLVSEAVVQRVAGGPFAFAVGRWALLKGLPNATLVYALSQKGERWSAPAPTATSTVADVARSVLALARESIAGRGRPSGILERKAAV